MYAIVDIETTGGYASSNGITEIAIIVYDGSKVLEKFQTLVNPGQEVPRYIQALTGITNEMVENAPVFEDVAGRVFELLNNRIFVAHNVNFDYSFLASHLNAAGYSYQARKLCTVRLSRKLFPGFPSYSLGNLCSSMEVINNQRHRAMGDADATFEIFKKLLHADRQGFIQQSLRRNSGEQCLPPNVPKEDFIKLPDTPGVYYFHNREGKVIYVGKAVNIRKRVNSHFSNNSTSRQKQNFLRHTYSISFESCATELMACILESVEIKRLWPEFNYSQKRQEQLFGIFDYVDQNGYLRLAIERCRRNIKPVHSFNFLVEGHQLLRNLIRDYKLCPRLCFMQHEHEPCDENCNGACSRKEDPGTYNLRVEEALASLSSKQSFAIVDKGLSKDEKSCILILKGSLYGMGYIPGDAQPELLKDYVKPYRENLTIRNLISGHAARFPSKLIHLSAEY